MRRESIAVTFYLRSIFFSTRHSTGDQFAYEKGKHAEYLPMARVCNACVFFSVGEMIGKERKAGIFLRLGETNLQAMGPPGLVTLAWRGFPQQI